MEIPLALLLSIIGIALIFDLVNGFHDAANSIATVVSTRVLTPFAAVIWAAFFNFIAMLIFPPKVAETISKIVNIEMNNLSYVYVIFAGLIAAIIWDLFTWRLGLPVSSSHALIGGISGAGLAYKGVEALRWDVLGNTLAFIFIAPLLGLCLGFLFLLILYGIFQKWSPAKVQNLFSKGQLVSAAMYSIGHGANDAQKTMGIILGLMIAAGRFQKDTVLSLNHPDTAWIIFSCQLALALGTALGGWRIVKTMGMKIVKLKPSSGFCAETAGALTLFLATHFGIPVSTTQTITGSIIGVGTVSTHLSRIKWGIATRVVWAWILTVPATAGLAALLFFCFR